MNQKQKPNLLKPYINYEIKVTFKNHENFIVFHFFAMSLDLAEPPGSFDNRER